MRACFYKWGFCVTTGILYQIFMKQEHGFVRPTRILGNFSDRSVSPAATSFLHLPRRQRNGRGELCPGHPGGLRARQRTRGEGGAKPIHQSDPQDSAPPPSLSSRGGGSRRGRRPHRTWDNLGSRRKKTRPRLRCTR